MTLETVPAATKLGGTSYTHRQWHGSLTEVRYAHPSGSDANDGYTWGSAKATIQAAVSALPSSGIGLVRFAGDHTLADGVGITLAENSRIEGVGRDTCSISVKDAYAFNATSKGGLDLNKFRVVVRSGATSGGAIKLDSTSSARLSEISCTSVSTCLTPAIYLKGAVNSHIDQCQAEGMAAAGIRMDATGGTLAFCNANTVYRSRVNSAQGATNAGIHVGGEGNRVRDCVIESNRGYGIYVAGGWNTVEGCWFEDNSNHNIFLDQTLGAQVTQNKFHFQHGEIGTADHINLTGTASQRAMNRIEGNIVQDASSSGVALRIGAGTEFTGVLFNRGLIVGSGTTLVDNGSYTIAFGNDNSAPIEDTIRMRGRFEELNIRTTLPPAAVGGAPETANSIFAVRDDNDDNYFMIGTRGIPIFRTGDIAQITGSDELQTNSFALYWDQAAGQIKARVRNSSGVYSTIVLG